MKYIKMKFLYLCRLLACPESTIVITDLSQLKQIFVFKFEKQRFYKYNLIYNRSWSRIHNTSFYHNLRLGPIT